VEDGTDAENKEKIEAKKQLTQPWTLVHGVYAQIGEFVLDTTNVYSEFLPATRGTLYLGSFCFILQNTRILAPKQVRKRSREHSQHPRKNHQPNQDQVYL
jgi:phage protein U